LEFGWLTRSFPDISVVENNSTTLPSRIPASQIVEMGTRDQIFANPRHPIVASRALDRDMPGPVCRLGDEPFKVMLHDVAMGTSSP
jgi:peptide/nickel transport system ATP-binding protein